MLFGELFEELSSKKDPDNPASSDDQELFSKIEELASKKDVAELASKQEVAELASKRDVAELASKRDQARRRRAGHQKRSQGLCRRPFEGC